MKVKKSSSGNPAVGAPSLLCVFAVLCLTVFTLLSLSSAKTDSRLSETSANATLHYYEADVAAQSVLADLRSGKTPAGVTKEDDVYEFLCPAGEDAALSVRVRVDGQNYEIIRYQLVSTKDWEAVDSMVVWDGE